MDAPSRDPDLSEAPDHPDKEEAPAPSRRGAIALLLAGAFCAGMGQTIVFSVLPPLARQMGLTDLQTGAVFAVSAACWVVTGPRWGRASDRARRKPFILIGLIGFALSMIAFSQAIRLGLAGALAGWPLYFLIVAARALYGLLGSAGPPATQAYIADRTSRAGRTAGMASFAAAFGFGAMLGPGVGAAAAGLAPVAPFLVMAAIGAAMAAIVAAALPENRPPEARAPAAALRIADARLRAFLIFAFAFGVINAVPMQTIGFYFLDRLGFSIAQAPRYVGLALTGAAMASLFSQLVLVRRLRLSPRALMRAAPLLIVLGHGLIAAGATFPVAALGMIVAGFGVGLAMPAFSGAASLAVRAEEQGSAIALVSAAAASGFIVAPFIGMNLFAVAPYAPFLLTAALGAGLALYARISPAIDAATPYQPPLPERAPPASTPYR